MQPTPVPQELHAGEAVLFYSVLAANMSQLQRARQGQGDFHISHVMKIYFKILKGTTLKVSSEIREDASTSAGRKSIPAPTTGTPLVSSCLGDAGEQLALPWEVSGNRQTGTPSSRVWSKGTVGRFPMPADREGRAEYSPG